MPSSENALRLPGSKPNNKWYNRNVVWQIDMAFCAWKTVQGDVICEVSSLFSLLPLSFWCWCCAFLSWLAVMSSCQIRALMISPPHFSSSSLLQHLSTPPKSSQHQTDSSPWSDLSYRHCPWHGKSSYEGLVCYILFLSLTWHTFGLDMKRSIAEWPHGDLPIYGSKCGSTRQVVYCCINPTAYTAILSLFIRFSTIGQSEWPLLWPMRSWNPDIWAMVCTR